MDEMAGLTLPEHSSIRPCLWFYALGCEDKHGRAR
jgi:hypothetical protein